MKIKNITSASLVLFSISLGYIYFSGLMFSNPITENPTPTSNKLENSSQKTVATVFKQPIIVKTQATTKPIKKIITSLDRNEVSKHSKANNCYLIINNKIYDVSNYINYHPGGSGIIISRCGTEVTGVFAQIHSNRAWDLLTKYKIGTLANSNIATTNTINLDLKAIEDSFKKANPNAEIINIKPKSSFYILKVIYNNKLYELHINDKGKLTKEEVENDEFDWSQWNNDQDDH